MTQGLVVSGFLGSGKTTLVRHLLEDAKRRGVRVAVVSNEFGELGIDQALLGDSAEAYVELEGGCVCCKLSDDLVNTLELLHERVQPERVIIETSGVALPYDTQLNFWREPVSRWISDDLALVVVNAEQVHQNAELEGTFEDQVSSAELIALNKIDLVPEHALAAIEAAVAVMAPDVPIVRCVQGDLDPALLFFDARSPRPREPRPHRHESFETGELAIEPGIASDALERRIRETGALRAKGFVRTADGLRLVQGVGERIELEPVDSVPDDALIGRVVWIRRSATSTPLQP